MKTAKTAEPTITRALAPERTDCPHCGQLMWADYAARRTVHTLAGVTRLNLTVRRCRNADCASPIPRRRVAQITESVSAIWPSSLDVVRSLRTDPLQAPETSAGSLVSGVARNLDCDLEVRVGNHRAAGALRSWALCEKMPPQLA